MIKKHFFTIVFSLLFVFSFVAAGRVWAGVSDQLQNYQEAVIDGRPNLQGTTAGVGMGFINLFLTQAGGCTLGERCAEGPEALRTDGAVKSSMRLFAGVFENPAASSNIYVADLLQNIGVAQPAHAQGLGFASLNPILNIWKIFRDIAYFFFVIIFLVIGFAIMFRKNLGGQTAVTVQQALPRIIVALLMVTFSYAIAGLLIDLMYIVMFLIITLFRVNLGNEPRFDLTSGEFILNANVFGVFTGMITNGLATTSGIVIGQAIEEMLVNSGWANIFASAANGITSSLTALIIFAAIIIAMFKTFFALIKIYFEIILLIIFSPIILMMGAIQSNAFGNWVKGLMANLAVFPAFLVFIMVGYLMIGNEGGSIQFADQFSQGGFVPPFLPGRGNAGTLGLIIGIGSLMLLPSIPEIMGRFKPKSIFDDLGSMAFKNAMAGEAAIPLAGGAIGGAYGGARGVGAYVRGTRAEGGPVKARDMFRAFRQGYSVDGRQVGGARSYASAGLRHGQNVRKTIDDALDGRLLQPDNLRAQLDDILKAQQDQKKSKETPKTGPDVNQ